MSKPSVLTASSEGYEVFNHPFELLNEKDKPGFNKAELADKDANILSAFIEPFATNWSSIVADA